MPSLGPVRDHLSAALSLIVATGCAHVALHPPTPMPGTFLNSRGTPLTDAALLARLRPARFVLVGESHDNVCDHQQEARLTRLLASEGRLTVGFEMVNYGRQSTLDEFSAGHLDLPGLATALDWKASWGFSWDWYAPIFDVARAGGAPIVGLNASDQIVHAVRDGGLEALSPGERLEVTPQLLPPPGEQEAMLRSAMEEHQAQAAKGADPKWERFVRVQSFWDSQMAWRAALVERALQRRVLIIAGDGHVAHGWGIAWRLRAFAPHAPSMAVVPWRGGELDPSEGDVFFYCPGTPESHEPPKEPPKSPNAT